MNLSCFVFTSLAVLVLASALTVVLMRNVLHSALALGLCLAGVAGLFAMLGADFLFGAQILIYVSGIAVLILFVVLLSGRASDFVLRQINEQWLAAGLVCGMFLWGLLTLFRPMVNTTSTPTEATTLTLGRLFLGDLAVPFELISLVLFAALLGAIFFSRPEEP